MPTSTTKRHRKQDAAIIAILTCNTMPRAAASCGIPESTLWRWAKEPDFAAALAEARATAFEGALGRLRGLAEAAVDTFQRNLACGNPVVEVHAAAGVIKQALYAHELLDIERRIHCLEESDEDSTESAEDIP